MDKYFIPKGPYATLMTPFKFDGTIDWEAYKTEVEFLATSPITGLVPCSATGEFIHMSPEDNMKLIETCAKVNNGRKHIIAGACATTLDTVAMYAQCAENCGCDAIILCAPYYINMPQVEIEEFFLRLSKGLSSINIMLYNIPMYTGEISIETYERLLQCENIIGIKDSSQNLKRISHLVDIKDGLRPDFSVFCGTDDMLLPSLVAGCNGSMTPLGTILPEAVAKIYSLFSENEIMEAEMLNKTYLKTLRLCDKLTFPAGYKLAMEKRGLTMGNKQVVSIEGSFTYKGINDQLAKEIKRLVMNCQRKY